MPVLRHHRGDVRVVVLHADQRDAALRRQPGREARAVEVGMQVVRDRHGFDREHVEQVIDGFLERHAGRRVVERPDVLRQEGFVAARGADRVLQVGADGEHRRTVAGEPDRRRRVAARAADEGRRPVRLGARHAVVAADQDGAVVHQQRVGDRAEAAHGFVVVDHQRLAAGIGARHHERERLRLAEPARSGGPAGGLVEQQHLQRRVRDHHAERRHPGRDAGQRLVAARLLVEQHDRPLGRGQQSGGLPCDARQRRDRREVREHHRERLLLALLAAAQFGDGLFIARVAHQVEAAQALDRDDAAAADPLHGFRERVRHRQRLPAVVPQRQPRSARRARVRLRVEATVGRRVVFRLARRALDERRHAGVRAVVGQFARDRVARSAVRAVRERVPPPPVRRIEHVGEAVGTDARVRRDAGRDRPARARDDPERAVPQRSHRRGVDRVDARQPRRLAAQAEHEPVERFVGAFELDLDAGAVVQHAAAEAEFRRQPIHRRPETDALHLSAHAQAAAMDGGGEHGRHRTATPRRPSAARARAGR